MSDSKDKFILRHHKKPSTETDVISIRIPHTLTERLDEAGRKTGHSRNQVIILALEWALDRMEIEEE